MSEIAEEYERNGLLVKIYYDEDAESSREWDNVGTMICSHRNYMLGDEQLVADEYEGWDEVKEMLIKDRKAVIVLPLGLYDHSGITMYVGDNHDRWDGGQVGFIYCTQEDIDREWNGDKEQAEKYLRAEVETYDQYLRGEVYGFTIKNPLNDEILDSCSGGFYGFEYAKEEVNSVADDIKLPVLEPIHYGVFKELFKVTGVNPYEFRKLSGDRVTGHFPNMNKRESIINVKEFAKVMWGRK